VKLETKSEVGYAARTLTEMGSIIRRVEGMEDELIRLNKIIRRVEGMEKELIRLRRIEQAAIALVEISNTSVLTYDSSVVQNLKNVIARK
jgi:hypothetical protein